MIRPPIALGRPPMTETQRPSLVLNPTDDVAFRDDVEAAFEEGQSVAELQDILRRTYPRTVVRAARSGRRAAGCLVRVP